jgi:hypothetical protein
MTKHDSGLVGTSRDEDLLLQSIGFAHDDLDAAVAAGALMQMKITNRWLYAPSSTVLEKGLEVAEAEAIRVLQPWLLGAAQWVQGPIAKASARPKLTASAVELLLRQLARDRRLGALGMVSGTYEPYLGLYGPDDEDEVARQVDALATSLRKRGCACSSDLPAPKRRRATDGWRSIVLRHGEFLGLGRLGDGVLTSWESVDGA